jgi:hypothetical protein
MTSFRYPRQCRGKHTETFLALCWDRHQSNLLTIWRLPCSVQIELAESLTRRQEGNKLKTLYGARPDRKKRERREP